MPIDWDAIRNEYQTTPVTLAELAVKYGIKYPTIKSRKQRQGWKKDASIKRKDASRKDASKVRRKDVNVSIKEKNEEAPELSDRQVLFCFHYVKSFNATMAAIKAGYAKSGAHVEGCRLLKNPKVREYIKQLKAEMQEEVMLNATDVLQEYMKIAFADISDYIDFGQKEILVGVDKKGNPITRTVNAVDLIDSDQVDGSVIQEIRQGKSGVSVKLQDKMKALEKLEKYFDLLPDHQQRRFAEEKLKLERERLEHTKKMDEKKVF